MMNRGLAVPASPSEPAHPRPVGLRDIPTFLGAPRRVLSRVEDVPAWRWPLLVLLTLVTLVGYASVETGLVDREVDRSVRDAIIQIESTQRDVVERSALRDLYEKQRKLGEFQKLLTRIQVIVAEPAKMLATVLITAALIYGAVALTGRKAEWHTLLTICVFAGYIDLLRLLTRLALMLSYSTLDVDTSAALLVRLLPQPDRAHLAYLAAEAGFLTAVDPFRIWFWLVIVMGVSVTAQLPGWRAWLVTALCWMIGGAVRGAIAFAQAMTLLQAAAAANRPS